MGREIETPGELAMIHFINSVYPGTLKEQDVGKAFEKGLVEEFEYLEYMNQLSNLYIKVKQDDEYNQRT